MKRLFVPVSVSATGTLVGQVFAAGEAPQWVRVPAITARLLGLKVTDTYRDSGYESVQQFGAEHGIDMDEALELVKSDDLVQRQDGKKLVPVTDKEGNAKHWHSLA